MADGGRKREETLEVEQLRAQNTTVVNTTILPPFIALNAIYRWLSNCAVISNNTPPASAKGRRSSIDFTIEISELWSWRPLFR